MIKAIIIDLDGVLVNSEKLKAQAWKSVLESYSIPNGDEFYRKNIGNSREALSKMAIKQFSLDAQVSDLFNKKESTYFAMLKQKTEPIQSTVEFIKSIPENIKVAINSSINKWVIEHQTKLVGIYDRIDAISSGLDEVQNDKPSPDIYLLTAKKINVKPEECIGIEDSTPGVISVKRAGMRCIGFINPNSGNQDLSKADITTDNLLKLRMRKIINL